MGNIISTFFFTGRNGEKALNGSPERGAVALVQGVNACEGVAKAGVVGSKTASAVINTIDEAAKAETIWGKSAKVLKWSQKHVNPLIGVCAGVKIATSDDKEKAFCTEVPGFMGMLAAEGKFKQVLKSQSAQNMLKSISDFGGKRGKFLAALTEGALFAGASIGGYMAASKLGEYTIEGERAVKARKLDTKA